jgi:membrane protease YdiL (CAAX protease family)
MSAWHPLLRGGLFIALYFLFAGLALALAKEILPALAPRDARILLTAITGFSATLASTALLVFFVDERNLAFAGLPFDRAAARQLAWGFACGLGMVAAIFALLVITGQSRAGSGDFSPARFALMGAAFFLAASAEEMLFRGYPFQRLVDTFGSGISVVILAALFGWVHRDNPSASWLAVINTVVVGVLLALAYLSTRRLWLPIGLHWGWNWAEAALGFPVSGIQVGGMPLATTPLGHPLWTGGEYGPEAGLPATLAGTAGIAVLAGLWKRLRADVG